MRISNLGEFFQFVKGNNLINMSPETSAMVICMEEYGRLCACDPQMVKVQKINQCKAFYVSFVRQADKFKNALFSKTSDNSITFATDQQDILTINR